MDNATVMNSHLKVYLQDTLNLVRGIRLKSVQTARAINTRLVALGYEVTADETTWKYYLNLFGVYHVSDVLMYVVSHDTYETIPFTKESLQTHLLTARNYTIGSRYYKDLLLQYPTQGSLIRGIIDPIPLSASISAEDHKILSYPANGVEANEGYLIPALQRFVDNFFFLRHNPDYALFSPNYYVGVLGILRAAMVTELLRLRLGACKTERAHSYHVRWFLLSNSGIGVDFDFLTFTQRMWLYKNILYINRNIGQTSTFKTLIKRILTDRGFGLVGYDMVKDIEGLVENLAPSVAFKQIQLNDILPAEGLGDKTVRQLLDLELSSAPDNQQVFEQSAEKTTLVGETSRYGKVPTKVLESNVLDRSDADPFTMAEVTLNHWIYLSHFDRYRAVTPISNPVNGDVYNLSMKECFILYLYVYNKALGIDFPVVPIVGANRVIRDPLPRFVELRQLAPSDLIPDYYLSKIIADQPSIGNYISIPAFRAVCRDIWNVLVRHREMRFFSGDYKKEGYLNTLTDRCYMDIRINLAQETSYKVWLEDRGIFIDDLSSTEYMTMALTILQTCTGQNLNDTTTLRDIHAAMLRIMRTLSSYSIQYTGRVNASGIKVIDGKFPMMSDTTYEAYIKVVFDDYFPILLDVVTRETSRFQLHDMVGLKWVEVTEGVTTTEIPAEVIVQLVSSDKETLVVGTDFPSPSLLPMEHQVLSGGVTVDNNHDLPFGPDITEPYPTPGYRMSELELVQFLQRSR